jgi:heat shock protein HslJ
MNKAFLIMLVCVLGLTACSSPDSEGNSPAVFEEQGWVLQYYRKSTAVEGVNANIYFSDGKVSGSTGCNSFSGEYTFNGEESGDLHITNLAVTEMACLEPQGLMDQEAFFLETLNDASRFEYSPGQLMIYQSGREALTYQLQND